MLSDDDKIQSVANKPLPKWPWLLGGIVLLFFWMFGGDHNTPQVRLSGGENSPNNPRTTPPQSAPLEQWEKDVDASLFDTSDFATAVRIVWPLAAQGNANAQHWLGLMYSEGWGAPQDDEETFKWFHRAADQNNVYGSWLGGMYEAGAGVPQDNVRAYLWYNLAAQNSKPGDQIAAVKRDFIARSMSPTQLVEAQKLATDWKPELLGGALPKPEDVPNVRSYQAWMGASPGEEWTAEGDRSLRLER
jgi:uncharacterized protein